MDMDSPPTREPMPGMALMAEAAILVRVVPARAVMKERPTDSVYSTS
jgi:hypothetical protein